MNLISRLIDWIFDPHEPSADADAEAFLAQSVDLHDLERRMRELDRRRAVGPLGMNA